MTMAMKHAVAAYSRKWARAIHAIRSENNRTWARMESRRAAPVAGLRHSAVRDLSRSDMASCFELMAPIRIALAEIITTGVTAAAMAAMAPAVPSAACMQFMINKVRESCFPARSADVLHGLRGTRAGDPDLLGIRAFRSVRESGCVRSRHGPARDSLACDCAQRPSFGARCDYRARRHKLFSVRGHQPAGYSAGQDLQRIFRTVR